MVLPVDIATDLYGRLELEQDGLGHEDLAGADACADQGIETMSRRCVSKVKSEESTKSLRRRTGTEHTDLVVL